MCRALAVGGQFTGGRPREEPLNSRKLLKISQPGVLPAVLERHRAMAIRVQLHGESNNLQREQNE